MDRFAVFAFRWMAARSCSLMRMPIFLFFISYSVSKSGCRASARRAAERRPAVCDARTLPKGRVQRRHLAVFCLLLRQKRKKGRTRRLQCRISPLHGLIGCLLGFLLARRIGRFQRLFRQREEFAVLFLFSAVIYTQWV